MVEDRSQITSARINKGIRINSPRTILYDELEWDVLSVRRLNRGLRRIGDLSGIERLPPKLIVAIF